MDEKSKKDLEELERELNVSSSEVVRRSLRILKVLNEHQNIPSSSFKDLAIALEDHILIDIELVFDLLKEQHNILQESGWAEDTLNKAGKRLGERIRARGRKHAREVMDYVEILNYGTVTKISKREFSVMPVTLRLGEALVPYLEGVFATFPWDSSVERRGRKVKVEIES